MVVYAKDKTYVPGQWHLYEFSTDLAQQEVVHFASALTRAYVAKGLPSDCRAYREEHSDKTQTVYLSPAASELADSIPEYRLGLNSCWVGNIEERGWAEMSIFE